MLAEIEHYFILLVLPLRADSKVWREPSHLYPSQKYSFCFALFPKRNNSGVTPEWFRALKERKLQIYLETSAFTLILRVLKGFKLILILSRLFLSLVEKQCVGHPHLKTLHMFIRSKPSLLSHFPSAKSCIYTRKFFFSGLKITQGHWLRKWHLLNNLPSSSSCQTGAQRIEKLCTERRYLSKQGCCQICVP